MQHQSSTPTRLCIFSQSCQHVHCTTYMCVCTRPCYLCGSWPGSAQQHPRCCTAPPNTRRGVHAVAMMLERSTLPGMHHTSVRHAAVPHGSDMPTAASNRCTCHADRYHTERCRYCHHNEVIEEGFCCLVCVLARSQQHSWKSRTPEWCLMSCAASTWCPMASKRRQLTSSWGAWHTCRLREWPWGRGA
jgi:hypothetical protein